MGQLSKILKDFTKVAANLEKLLQANTKQVGENRFRISELQADNLALVVENKEAEQVLNNINRMLGK